MHAHVTFDSASKCDGYKFHLTKGDWEKRIQPITNRICKKYEIPTLSYEKEDTKGGWITDPGRIAKRKRNEQKLKRTNARIQKRKKKNTQEDRAEKRNQNGFSKANAQGNENFKREVDPSDQYRNEEVDSMKFS